ncbi:SIR2 family protein [Flavobacterium sp. MC2016-06]|jgi:hypothetical protein|uniref:SIR2 family protein n=1 Tax=Flavobacterium sp. MC2016-06 TaxID=2676308 RepID=UPI0012BA74B7|nr:SIR2 family protein [Flavobacterium sp. MC2016-06]MBU3860144.1 SIR2 family protein [Flavobacterium sp. MC2016-06]
MDFENIKKIIESCHLNFLIGSGASRPFLGTLGTIEKLLTDLAKSNISDDNKIIIDASIKKHYWDVAIKGNLNINDTVDPSLNITKKAYNDFYNSLNTILNKRKTNLISKKANVFTTNMDLFNEKALEEAGNTYNDGFSGRLNPIFGTENFNNSITKTSSHFEFQSEIPLFNLFKLHGSVNWLLNSEGKIKYDSNLEILYQIDAIKIDKKDLLDIEYKKKIKGEEIWISYTLDELEAQILKNKIAKIKEHDQFLEAYDKLIMINPTKEKFETTTRKLIFYELLRMYSNNLEKENSVLFVFGFSFADEHIREITIRVAKANPTLLIVIFAFNKAAKEDIEKELTERNNVVYIYDKDNKINFSLDTINEKYFKKLVEELISTNS